MNDYLSLLDSAEVNNIHIAQQAKEADSKSFETVFLLPKMVLEINYRELGFDLFSLRLTNVLLLILTLLGFIFWGEKLFGQSTVLLTSIVVSSTFLVVPVAKFITFDTWLLAFQLMSFITLILLLKQPIWKWRILFWIFTIGALLIEPKSALIFSFGMWLFLIIVHPNGRALFDLYNGLLWLAAFAGLYFLGSWTGDRSGFLFSYTHIEPQKYLLINLLVILPWIAFLPAAIWDLIQKLRKQEEMAIISCAFLLFSALSYGLVLQFAIAFLIAKQLDNFFKTNYPYSNLVKSIAVLNLVFSFALVALFLLTNYDNFGEIGFRSRMGVAGVYWAFGFLAVIGLFGKSRKMIVGGMALSGMLTMLLFWTQISPLLENYRNLAQKLIFEIEKVDSDQESKVYLQKSHFLNDDHSKKMTVYLKGKKISYEYFTENDSLKDGIFILDEAQYSMLDSTFLDGIEKIPISGRSHIFDKKRDVWILKN